MKRALFLLLITAAVTVTLSAPSALTTTVVYTTGTFHLMPGQVTVTLDGNLLGVSEAALPGGTVNSPLPPVPITAGTHQLVLQFASTNGNIPASWGGFTDLYLEVAR